MTQSDRSDSPGVWVNPATGGVESTVEWQQRLNAGDPAAHRELAALASVPPMNAPEDGYSVFVMGRHGHVTETSVYADSPREAAQQVVEGLEWADAAPPSYVVVADPDWCFEIDAPTPRWKLAEPE